MCMDRLRTCALVTFSSTRAKRGRAVRWSNACLVGRGKSNAAETLKLPTVGPPAGGAVLRPADLYRGRDRRHRPPGPPDTGAFPEGCRHRWMRPAGSSFWVST